MGFAVSSHAFVTSGVLFVQGLQQKNMELLTVVRQLSDEKDHERALLEQDKAKDREALEAEKNALYVERTKQQVPLQSCQHLLTSSYKGLFSSVHLYCSP